MRHAPRVLLAAGLGFAVSFLVACGGGSNLLSGDQSSSLESQLADVAQAAQDGQCAGAAQSVASASNLVSNLPSHVSAVLRTNLEQGVSTVNRLSQRDCQRNATTASTSSTSTTDTTTPTTTSTTTTTPTTTPSTTTVSTTTPTSTTTTPATPTTPPSTSTTTPTTGGAGIGGSPPGAPGSGGGAPGQP